MVTYTIPQLENEGFAFTGVTVVSPSITSQGKLAKELNITMDSLRCFRLSTYEWAYFISPDTVIGYKEEALLP